MSIDNIVGDYMSRSFLTVSPNDTLDVVAKGMVKTGNEFALVMDQGDLCGLVSVGEIIHEVRSSIVSRLPVDKIPSEFRKVLMSELMRNPRTINFMESCGFDGTSWPSAWASRTPSRRPSSSSPAARLSWCWYSTSRASWAYSLKRTCSGP